MRAPALAARESDARLRAIFESASVAILRLEEDRRIAECNPAFEELLGYPRGVLVGRSLGDLTHPEDEPAAAQQFRAVWGGTPQTCQVERRLVGATGTMVWVSESTSMVRGDDGGPRFAVCVMADITARKLLEVTLRHAQKLESVGMLAAGIAHEINTPIQFIGDNINFIGDSFRGLLALLERYRAAIALAGAVDDGTREELREAEEDLDLGYLMEEVGKAIEQSLDGVSRVSSIVQALKTFAHPERADQAHADINHALQSTLTVARNEIKYVADVECDLTDLPLVNCYVTDINQVFLNLLVNAAHAIADRPDRQRGKITVRTRCEGEAVVVAIADTGTGIPDAIAHKIFDPFFTTKEVGRGTGQGLALARAVVVDKHGGSLTFETRVGEGTVFYVRLPVEGRSDRRREAT